MAYVGRFAPSPTGSLHLGTLTAAVASYLHARQAGGRWLLRIEDIDPPREVAGSADSILRTLEAFDLEWDGAVTYQSTRFETYRAIVAGLIAEGLAFRCSCSRTRIQQHTGGTRYPGTCRYLGLTGDDAAVRVLVEAGEIAFSDGVCGERNYDIAATDGDFVIFRRDGLPAYHLAVVVDDADQGVTDIVRGSDLLASTPLHIYLQRLLGVSEPRYWHIPLLTTRAGEKLSKSAGTAAVDDRDQSATAARILRLLGLDPVAELEGAAPALLWQWAADKWRIERLAQLGESLAVEV